MPRVANDEFIERLRELFEDSRIKGSVYLEQKRLARTGPDCDLHATQSPYPLVFRATNGAREKANRKKVSTVVEAENLVQFWSLYTEALKKGAAGLRKKEKKEKRRVKK